MTAERDGEWRTHRHANTHANTHTYIHTHACTHAYARAHARIRASAHALTPKPFALWNKSIIPMDELVETRGDKEGGC